MNYDFFRFLLKITPLHPRFLHTRESRVQYLRFFFVFFLAYSYLCSMLLLFNMNERYAMKKMTSRVVGAFRVFAVVAVMTSMGSVVAQEIHLKDSTNDSQLNIDLQMLAQGEVRNGGVVNPDDPTAEDRSNFVVGRTRLIIDYLKGNLEMKVVPQHLGIWGQKGQGSFNLYEAWAKYSIPQGFFVQIGRQVLSYDDERILGPNDWAMAAQTHDLLRMGFEGYGHKVHALLAYNQNTDEGGTYYVDGAQSYKTMQTLWYHYDVPKTNLGVSLMFMNLGVQGMTTEKTPKTYNQQLLGTHITWQPSWGAFSGCYYRQMGKNGDGIKMEGWMTAYKATVNASSMLKLTAGFDYLSGDKYFAVPKPGQIGLVQHEKLGGFTPLYGSHHKFYGAMEFFYVNAYVNGFSPGLQNAYIGGDVTIARKLTISPYYHYMAMATKLKDINMTLGHMIDLSLSYQFNKDINISAGYSFMTGTETMERLKRASGQSHLRWFWLSVNITPRLLSLIF